MNPSVCRKPQLYRLIRRMAQDQDGTDFDGKNLLTLVRNGNSPFVGAWDVNLLIQEIEENLTTQVIDISVVSNGSNYYVSRNPRTLFRIKANVGLPTGYPFQIV